jgi:hypothetical protein
MIATISPRATSSDTPSSARTAVSPSPKTLTSSRASSADCEAASILGILTAAARPTGR